MNRLAAARRAVRCRGGILLIAILAVCSPVLAQTAQSDLLQSKGVQPERNYFSPEPWEHFDPVTGNLILTFTDLTLPGNAGRALRFQRTFNSQWTNYPEYPTVSRWSFGFPGLVMRVIEKPAPASMPSFEEMLQFTPVFLTGDGARRRTIYMSDPAESRRWVVSGEFYEYDQDTNTLYMPDGTVCHYDDNGYLMNFTDPFNNLVTLERSGNELTVTQVNEARQVVLTVDADGLVTRMTFDSREWNYFYQLGARRDIERLGLPVGPDWTFTYVDGDLTTVRTPNGGTVTYTYDYRTSYPNPMDPTVSEQIRVLRYRDSDSGVVQGHWEIDPQIGYGQTYAGSTVISTPSAKVVYLHQAGGFGSSANLLEGGFGLITREIRSLDDVLLEREEQHRILVPVATPGSEVVTTEVGTRTITRYDGGTSRTYTTEYTYDTTQFGNYHHPTRIAESGPPGELVRTTDLAYLHLQTPYILGLPATEDVTVGSETFHKAWTYNFATGFRQTENVYGVTTTFTKDTFGNVETVAKGNGKKTTYAYSGGVISQMQTDEPGYVVTRMIKDNGTVESETRAGRTITYTYDPLFRPTVTQPPGGTNPIVIEYDPSGTWVKTSRGASQVTTTLDGFGRPVRTTNAVGVETRTAYDAEGRVVEQGYPFKTPEFPDQWIAIEYDGLGRVTKRTNPDATFRTLTYGPGIVTSRDENGRESIQTLKAFGDPDDVRLTALEDADGKTWAYAYTALGRLTRVTAPDGITRTWTYDTKNLLRSETHPESGTMTYVYDEAGVLVQKTDAKGTLFTYGHDANDRVSSITAGSSVTTITYEPGSDNRLSTSNGTASSTFAYDSAGRLAQRQDVVGAYVFSTGYAYDGNDSVTEITYPSGRKINYEYNAERQIIGVSEAAAGRNYALGMTYHPSGALKTYTAGNAIATTVTYDPQRYWVRSIASGPLQLTYDNYDNVGNVRTIGDSRPGMNQTLTYDTLDRVHTAGGAYGSLEYLYNAHGNRIDASGSTYTYEPGTLRLSAQNGIPYGYDNNGNMTSAGANTYTYTSENMLASATVAGASVTFGYDADGWRAKKVIPGDTTVYLRGAGNELLTEWHNLGTSARTRDYVYAGTRLLSAIDKTSDFPASCGGRGIPDGSPTAVTIAAGATGTVTFEGSACRRVSVKVVVTSGSFGCSWSVTIKRPTGTTLASATGCNVTTVFIEPVTLPVSGTYTVIVDPAGSSTGTANVHAYDIVDITTPITVDGPAVTAALTTPGQKTQLPFTAAAGHRISAVVTLTAGTFNCCATVEIRNANNVRVGNNTGFYGTAPQSVILEPVTLPADGTYTLVVNPDYWNTGTVSVRLYDIVDVTAAIAVDGPAVEVTVTKPGQNALLAFAGTGGRRVSAVVTLTAGTFNCCTRVEIRNANNVRVGNDTGFYGTAPQSVILEPVTLPADGTYTLVVNPDYWNTGTVSVRLYDIVDVATPITIDGPTVTANLTKPGQNTRLPFTGTAGQRVSVYVRLTSGTFNCCARVRIINAATNATVGSDTGFYGTAPQAVFLEPVTLPATQDYAVVVDPDYWNVGTVDVNLSNVQPDITGSISINGSPVPIAIPTSGQNAILTTNGTSGQKVTMRITSSTIGSTTVKLRKPDNSTLTSTTSSATNFNLSTQILPSSGTYSVLIDPSTTNTGSLNVAVTSP